MELIVSTEINLPLVNTFRPCLAPSDMAHNGECQFQGMGMLRERLTELNEGSFHIRNEPIYPRYLEKYSMLL
jgi:hypothetical protein